jgi:uncharacterized protein (TIGR03790 family)
MDYYTRRLPHHGRYLLILFICVALISAAWIMPAYAELTPDQIAIVACAGSRDSRALAEYYAKVRHIPPGRIHYIDVAPGKPLRRADWQSRVRPALQRWILGQKLEAQLRCLVTVWDVPLKIGQVAEQTFARQILYLEAERRGRVGRLAQLFDEINGIAHKGDVPPVESLETKPVAELGKQLEATFQRARSRVLAAPERQAAQGQLLRAMQKASGLRAVVQMLSQQPPGQQPNLELVALRESTQGRARGIYEGRAALERLPDSVQKDEQTLALVEVTDGIFGSIKWLDQRLKALRKNESQASFDSELSLLFWPDYPLLRWQPNLLHYRYDDSPIRSTRPTLMVARLEAPTVAQTRKLIDTAIAVEQTGLSGQVYLDARGMAPPKAPAARGSYAEYDESIRALSRVLQAQTKLKVHLDNKGQLFQPGTCPDAALYCGWYSLGKYVDAFSWVPGSVGYHIASSEATTLRSAKSQVWCKRMLEKGVCATLGPAFEPYLTAFPKPDEFFVVLLSGEYSLVETYYRTKPFNSWAMVLVGDPLYRPFAKHPAWQAGQAPPDYARAIGQ